MLDLSNDSRSLNRPGWTRVVGTCLVGSRPSKGLRYCVDIIVRFPTVRLTNSAQEDG